jgi:tetratricopeptide (TPR) repeat protein
MRMSLLLVILLLGLKLSNGPSPEKLLQEGHRALARGDYERAAAFYEQAELHSTDPAEVAFYLAGAKYHLAKKVESISPELLEAEQLYRCCLDPSDPHRPYALCGLGNCLLHKAGSSDEGSLRSAIACYDLCLQCAGDDKALAAAARYNREKARLLLLQFLPPISDSASERPPIDDLHPHLPRPRDYRQAMPMPAGMDGADGSVDPPTSSGDAKQDQEKDAAKSNEPPQPGKGNLPPIPDEVDAPPLPANVAGEHLELAAKRVLHERQIHHRRDEETSAKGVKDW